MKYLTALWHALMTFLSHIKTEGEKETRQAEQEAAQKTRETEAAREVHDAKVRDISKPAVDKRLDPWMRD